MRRLLSMAYVVLILFVFVFMESFPVSYVKGVIVRSGEVRSYVDGVFSLTESIVVEGNASLIIENATLEFVQRRDYEYGIKLLGSVEGSPFLRVKNATLKSSKGVLISVSNGLAEIDCLSFDGAGKSRGKVELNGNAYLRAISSNIPYIYCYGSSRSFLMGSNPNYLYFYENASGIVDGCTVYSVEVYDFGCVNVSLSDVKSSIFSEDFGRVFVDVSSVIGRVSSYDNSIVGIMNSKVHQLKVTVSGYGNVFLENVVSLASKYPQEIMSVGFSFTKLVNCRFSDFVLRIQGNSTLTMVDSFVSASVFYLSGFSKVNFSNSHFDWLVEAFDGSSINAFGSTFNILSLEDSSSLNAVGCKVGRLRCFESSKVFVSDSVLKDVLVELLSFNRTLSGFSEGYFDDLSFVAGDLSVTFLRSNVDVGWSFRFLGSSNVSFHDSRLVNLYAGDQSTLHLFNTTYVNLNVRDAAVVEVWSYLIVRVMDYFGVPVSGVNVTVLLPSPVTVFTDGDGRASFLLLERVVNASWELVLNSYSFVVVFDGSSSNYSIELAGSRLVSCGVASPWWYWYLVYGVVGVVVVAVALSVFMFRMRRVKALRSVKS